MLDSDTAALENPSAIWLTPSTRQALDRTSDYFIAFDRNYVVAFANRRLTEANRPRHAQLVGRQHWELWPEVRGTVIETAYDRAFATGHPEHLTYRYANADIWVELDIYPSGDYLHVYFRDVTAKRRIQQMPIGDANAPAFLSYLDWDLVYRFVVDSVPEIAWTAKPDGAVDYFNGRWHEYTGSSAEGDANWESVLHPDDVARSIEAWQSSIETGETYEIEVRLRKASTGEYRWFLARARPLRDQEGAIVRWFGVTSEIHEQKVREQTLRFLAELTEATRQTSDPLEVIRINVTLLGQYLGTTRCAYGEMEPDGDAYEVVMDYADGVESARGRYRLSSFGALLAEEQKSGRPTIVRDVRLAPQTKERAEALEARNILAFVSVPLVKDGRLTAIFGLHHREPRDWTSDEVELVETVADRCWSSIERVRAERALLQSEAQYRQIAEGLPQLVWSAAPNGRRDYFNWRWVEFTGTDLSTHEKPWVASLHPKDRERAVELWARAVSLGAPFQAEYRLRRRNGDFRWFLGRAIPLRNEEGEIVRWFGTCTDIHDQKSAQHALEISNAFATTLAADLDLERIVQALTDACTEAVSAEFGSFFYNVTNEEGESYLLYTLSGAPMEAFAKFGMPRATPVFAPTFNGEGIIRSDNIRQDPRYGKMGAPHHGQPKGHLPVVSYLAVPVTARSGEVIGGLFFGHSEPGRFTEEHETIVSSFAAQAAVAMDNARLYDQLRGMNEVLERKVAERTGDLLAANERMQGFTYHVSHDLRAPLRAIVSTSRMIQEDFGENLPAGVNQLLSRQAEAANKLGQLVDDLLKLSRLSRQEMIRQPVDLTALARDAAAEALSTHPYSTVHVDVEEGLSVEADPRLLRLALLNLIENAVKYSPSGGTVRVGRDAQGRYLVSDEGIGMEPQYLHKIFEPFQRLHNDREFSGTGIGLANVRQVIERHGGSVWAESEPGRGSTFFFTLG